MENDFDELDPYALIEMLLDQEDRIINPDDWPTY